MIDLASIRNASFTLTPTGYNPEEVDRFLGSIADQLAAAPAPRTAQNEPEHFLHSEPEQAEPEFESEQPEPEPEPEAEPGPERAEDEGSWPRLIR